MQRQEVAALLSAPSEGAASLAAIELGVDDERRCPHCGAGGAVSSGARRAVFAVSGARTCGKTFGALTGTALSGLHHKERWLAFGASLAEGETIKESAGRCGIAPSTAHRWRHRFLAAVRQAPDRLAGIVEADETFVLESRKGERELDRKPRRRGGKAKKRGLSREQAPVLVAADRGGATLTLPMLNADSVKKALKPVLAPDALLVSDANRCYPPVAAARPSRMHQRLGWRAGPGCGAYPDGQQPPNQGFPATPARHRYQIPRQLSEVVPSHRTRKPAIAQSLPPRRNACNKPTIRKLSLPESFQMSRKTNARGRSNAGHMQHFQRGGRPQAQQRHQA